MQAHRYIRRALADGVRCRSACSRKRSIDKSRRLCQLTGNAKKSSFAFARGGEIMEGRFILRPASDRAHDRFIWTPSGQASARNAEPWTHRALVATRRRRNFAARLSRLLFHGLSFFA